MCMWVCIYICMYIYMNVYMCVRKNISNHSNYKHWQIQILFNTHLLDLMPNIFTHKMEMQSVNFKTTKQSMIHKKAVGETKTNTHTYTHARARAQLQLYQISKKGKADQSKHTPGKRNKNPYKNKSDQTRIIYTGNRSEFKSHWVPHLKGLVPHVLSHESNKLETHIYITRMSEQNK